MGGRDQETILINVDFADFVTILRFKDDSLPIFDSSHKNLRKWDICEFKFALIPALLKADFEKVDGATKWSYWDFRAILSPCTCSDWVVVFNLFASDLVPLWSFRVEVVNVESIVVSDDTSLTGSVKCSTGKLLNPVIFRVIESLEAVSSRLIECDLTIVAASYNVWAPGKRVRYRRMGHLVLNLSVQVKRDDWVVKEARHDAAAVWWRADTYDKRLLPEQRLRLVRLHYAEADFSFGRADNKFVCALIWPGHACDGGALLKLVADRLFLAPVAAQLVDKHDVVRLRNC